MNMISPKISATPLKDARPWLEYSEHDLFYFHAQGRIDERVWSALDFVRKLMDAPIERIAVENPISVISSKIRKPDQIIQPWQFGTSRTFGRLGGLCEIFR